MPAGSSRMCGASNGTRRPGRSGVKVWCPRTRCRRAPGHRAWCRGNAAGWCLRSLIPLGESLDRGASGKGDPGLDNFGELLQVTRSASLTWRDIAKAADLNVLKAPAMGAGRPDRRRKERCAMLETISHIAECSTYLIAAGYLGFVLCRPFFSRKTF
jgi:hypothetical protein